MPLRKSAVAICVPNGISEVGKKAIWDAVCQAGAREIMIADTPADQFIKEIREKSPQLYQRFQIVMVITKDEAKSYLREQLSDILNDAEQSGISTERVAELLAERLK